MRNSAGVALWRMLVFAHVLLFADGSGPVSAQQSHVNPVPLAVVLRDADLNHIPDRLGDTVIVAGIVTWARSTRARDVSFHIQDGTAGVSVVLQDSLSAPPGLGLGAFVTLRGIVGQDDGSSELEALWVTATPGGPAPVPRPVLAADLAGERYEGQLVEVSGRLEVPDNFSSSDTVFIADRSGRIPVRVSDRYFRTAGFLERLRRGAAVVIVGIADQDKDEPPYDSGYRLRPRDLADFHFPVRPPYAVIAGTGIVLVTAGTILQLHRRRRRAERQARQIERYLDDLRRSEAVARESEQRYLMLFERNPLPLWVFDTKTLGFLAVNDRAIRQYGYSREEFLRLRVTDIHPLSEVSAMLAHLARDSADAAPTEWRHRTQEGRIIFVEMTGHAIEFDGRAARLVLAHDVTERRRVLHSLARSEASYRSFVDGCPFGVFRSDGTGRLLAVNPALVTLLGYRTAEDLLDVETLAVHQGEDWRNLFQARAVGDRIEGVEVEWARADGTRILLRLCGRLQRSPDGKQLGFEMYVEDITGRRELEQQLRQAQKMEAVGQLAGGIAHDFNNLLTTITATAELAAEEHGPLKGLAEDLAAIRRAGARGAELTSKLLAFGRKQRLEMLPVNLGDVAQDFVRMVRRVVREDIVIAMEIGRTQCSALADPGAIEQILLNLVTNARDAMPNGGRLEIRIDESTVSADACVALGLAQPGEYVVLTVADTGIGMDADTRRRVFEPFFTTKPVGAGTGLGMAMVYGLVKQHAGFIEMDSEVGRGTIVRIGLPATRDAAVSTAVPVRNAGTRIGGETILLVEDDDSLRHVAERVLRKHGYDVILATNGVEALAALRGAGRDVRLVLSDVVMPEMGGATLAQEMRRVAPDIHLLLMSGHPMRDLRESGALERGVPFLAKPWTIESLIGGIQEALNQRPLASHRGAGAARN